MSTNATVTATAASPSPAGTPAVNVSITTPDPMVAHVPASAREQAIADAQLRYSVRRYPRHVIRQMYHAHANTLYASHRKYRPATHHGLLRRHYKPHTLAKTQSSTDASTTTLHNGEPVREGSNMRYRGVAVRGEPREDASGLMPEPRVAIEKAGLEVKLAEDAKVHASKHRSGSDDMKHAKLRHRAAVKEFHRLIRLDHMIERLMAHEIGHHLRRDYEKRSAHWHRTGNARYPEEKHVNDEYYFDHFFLSDHERRMREAHQCHHHRHHFHTSRDNHQEVEVELRSPDCGCIDGKNCRCGVECRCKERRAQQARRQDGQVVERDFEYQPTDLSGNRHDQATVIANSRHAELHLGAKDSVGDSCVDYTCDHPYCRPSSEGYLGMLLFNFIHRGELHMSENDRIRHRKRERRRLGQPATAQYVVPAQNAAPARDATPTIAVSEATQAQIQTAPSGAPTPSQSDTRTQNVAPAQNTNSNQQVTPAPAQQRSEVVELSAKKP